MSAKIACARASEPLTSIGKHTVVKLGIVSDISRPCGYMYLLMSYPCSWFYADIRFDNRFGIKLWNSIHVDHTINFVTKL